MPETTVSGRVHDRAPAIAVGRAVALVPASLHELTACEFIIGVDPVFAGIHRYDVAPSGNAYRDVAHTVHDFHQTHRPRADRSTKIVLPANTRYRWDTWDGVRTVVHELGHVLHARLGFNWIAEPVSTYAHTNKYEAFAEAFAAWVWGERIDAHTDALLESLAA